MNELISIIVPVYNVEKYLDKCIKSIINQTYKNIEIILVDDGSTDNSKKICDDYKKIDNRIKVIHKKNGGLSSARNKGIDISNGKYLMFIDSDDYIEKNMTEKLYDNLVKYDCDMAVCNFYKTVNNKDKKNPILGGTFVLENDKKYNYLCNFHSVRTIVSWNKLYKKELFKNIRYPLGHINEDEYIITDLLKESRKIVYMMDDYLYHYVQRPGSIMKTYDKKRYDIVRSLNKRIDDLEKLDKKSLVFKTKVLKQTQEWYLNFMCKVKNKKTK